VPSPASSLPWLPPPPGVQKAHHILPSPPPLHSGGSPSVPPLPPPSPLRHRPAAEALEGNTTLTSLSLRDNVFGPPPSPSGAQRQNSVFLVNYLRFSPPFFFLSEFTQHANLKGPLRSLPLVATGMSHISHTWYPRYPMPPTERHETKLVRLVPIICVHFFTFFFNFRTPSARGT